MELDAINPGLTCIEYEDSKFVVNFSVNEILGLVELMKIHINKGHERSERISKEDDDYYYTLKAIYKGDNIHLKYKKFTISSGTNGCMFKVLLRYVNKYEFLYIAETD